MLFWGLFLSLFNLNYAHLNLFITTAGALLLAAALWHLRPNGPWLRRAFIASLFSAFVQVALLVLACLKQTDEINYLLTKGITVTGNFTLTASIGAFQIISWVALTFCLFEGLSQMAAEMGDSALAGRLLFCFWLTPIQYALFAASIFFPIIFPALMLLPILFFIYILLETAHFNRLAPKSAAFKEAVPGIRFHCAAGGTVVLLFLVCFGALSFSAAPPVATRPYIMQSGGTQAASLRQKLKRAGMPQSVLNDLPSSEVLRCKTMHNLIKSSCRKNCDGGTLCMTEYFICLQHGQTRVLYYYDWEALPRHRYCDYFWIDLNHDIIAPSQKSLPKSVFLYNTKAPGGFKTLRSDPVSRLNYKDCPPNVEYRLWGAGAVRQRGFIAFDAQIQDYKEVGLIQPIVNYTHQVSIFTLDDIPPTVTSSDDLFSRARSNESTDAYTRFQLSFLTDYKP